MRVLYVSQLCDNVFQVKDMKTQTVEFQGSLSDCYAFIQLWKQGLFK